MSNLHRKMLMITIREACKPNDDCDRQKPPTSENHHLSPLKIMMICTLAATFVFVCYITIFKTCRAFKTRWRSRTRTRTRTRSDEIIDQTNQDLIDEDHEPVVFHPIWLINTVGLDQSVIDSIQMFKYRKEDGLIDDSDCAVCLGIFEEEENLRLLPKCSHSFHVNCIDTWLRSHKNCPLCRAPVVNNTSNHQIDQNFVESSSDEETPFRVPQNEILEVEIDQNCSPIDTNCENSDSEKISFTNGVRVQSDLTNHCSKNLEPIRRSISMGSFCSDDHENGELNVSQKPNVVLKSAKLRGSSSSIKMYNRVVKSSSFGPRIDLEKV